MKPFPFAIPAGMMACGLLFALLLPGTAPAQTIPALSAVPENLPEKIEVRLDNKRLSLLEERRVWAKAADDFNALTAEQQTDAQFKALNDRRGQLINQAIAFNREVAEAEAALGPPNQDDIREIAGIIALAKQLGWSAERQDRLERALNSLHNTRVHGGDLEGASIRSVWRSIEARGQGGDFARETAQGEGQELYAAGTQTRYGDCAIFALASATGRPYGEVAAQAAFLISKGEWRTGAERAHPEELMEQHGLDGGEVILLAESFGESQVVPRVDFPRVLGQGRPVLVTVVSEDGNAPHQAVLTKAFTHNGEYPWYEMIDSHQETQDRRYLSAGELKTMLLQDGVAYRPEQGSTVPLLR